MVYGEKTGGVVSPEWDTSVGWGASPSNYMIFPIKNFEKIPL